MVVVKADSVDLRIKTISLDVLSIGVLKTRLSVSTAPFFALAFSTTCRCGEYGVESGGRRTTVTRLC